VSERLGIETFGAGGDMRGFESVRERVYTPGPRTPPGPAWPSALWTALPPPPPEPLAPGTACLLARRNGEPVARCSILAASGLHAAPETSGMIGHYEALEGEAGAALITQARERLAESAVARVLGPMNGNTWARYRLALPSEPADPSFDPPVFPAEPRNPFDYPDHFAAAGFEVAARYESRIDTHLDAAVTEADALAGRVCEAGVTIRTLDLSRFDDELEALFRLSLEAFADNLYYTPIDLDSFRAMYQGTRALIDPELVLLAHDRSGRLVAYQFAFPDPVSRFEGRATRVIVKTVATAPEARGLGIASHMLDLIRERARAKGYRAVIHALMHVSNFSVRMSVRHQGQIFRRYALYQWTP